MACCECCEQTGACCDNGTCTQETCAACAENGGSFQGVGTECEGEDECPCDPPADPALCERCVDGEAESFCPEAKPYCCGGVCQEEACPVGACCDDQGDCSETTEAECEGDWHEGVSCEDIDCESGCCFGNAVTIDGCGTRSGCKRGVVHHVDWDPLYPCGNDGVECDPVKPDPTGPTVYCEGGQPTTVTVTGAGFVSDLDSGDPADDAELESAINASYVVDLDCAGAATQTFDYPNWTVYVILLYASRSVTIQAVSKLFIEWNVDVHYGDYVGPAETDCGDQLFQCGPFSGSYGDAGWQVFSQNPNHDFTGASLDVT